MQNGAKAAIPGCGAFTAAFHGHGRALLLPCHDLAERPCSNFTHTPISPIHRISPISPIGLIGPISATNTPKLRNEPKSHPWNKFHQSTLRIFQPPATSKRTHPGNLCGQTQSSLVKPDQTRSNQIIAKS